MTQPRRRILRRPVSEASDQARSKREVSRLLVRLETERVALARWTSRLKRAFHAFERQHARITRLEKRLTREAE